MVYATTGQPVCGCTTGGHSAFQILIGWILSWTPYTLILLIFNYYFMRKHLILSLLVFPLLLSGCDFFGFINNNKNTETSHELKEFPTDEIGSLIKQLNPSFDENIPEFTNFYAVDLKLYEADDVRYVQIFLKTEASNPDEIYLNSVIEAGWETDSIKVANFYSAYSPKDMLWINFETVVIDGTTELDIYVAESQSVYWPADKIKTDISNIHENILSTVPSFRAKTYVSTYYEQFNRVAINGFGVKSDIVSTYKTKLESLNWIVEETGESGTFSAYNVNRDIQIEFYYNSSKNEFNVDVSLYVGKISSWPKEQIDALLLTMGVTGSVEPFIWENKGFSVDEEFYPPCIFIYIENGNRDGEILAKQYNDYLVRLGYVVVGQMYGEDVYSYPETTLGYRAAHLNGNVVTIELFNIEVIGE